KLYVAGTFGGSMLGVTSTSSYDGFLVALDPTSLAPIGTTKVFTNNTATHVYMRDIAASAQGGVAITGYVVGSVNFGGMTFSGNNAIFMAKFNSGIVHQWSKVMGGSNSAATGYGVAMNGAGEVTVVGEFYTYVDFGGGIITAPGAGSDI